MEVWNKSRVKMSDRFNWSNGEIAWVFPHLSPLFPLLSMVRTLLHVTGLWAVPFRAIAAIPILSTGGIGPPEARGEKEVANSRYVGSLAFHLVRIPDRARHAGSVPAG